MRTDDKTVTTLRSQGEEHCLYTSKLTRINSRDSMLSTYGDKLLGRRARRIWYWQLKGAIDRGKQRMTYQARFTQWMGKQILWEIHKQLKYIKFYKEKKILESHDHLHPEFPHGWKLSHKLIINLH